MAVSFRCPKCGTAFRVDDTMLGKAVICPNHLCRQKSILPKSSSNDSPKPVAKVQRSSRAKYSSREPAAANEKESTSPITPTIDDRHQMSHQTLMLIAGGVATFMFAAIVGLLIFQRLGVSRVASVDQVPSDPDENASKEDASQTQKLPDPLPPEPSEAPVAESKQMKDEPLSSTTESKDSAASEPTVAAMPPTDLLSVEQVVAKVEASVACINGRTGGGSGFVIREGMIATNRHVIEKQLISQLQIHFPTAPMDQRGPFPAELIYVDPVIDLAFLKVPTSIAPLTTVQTHTFRRGQEVIAIGSPGVFASSPEQMTLQNAVSQGVVSTEAIYQGQHYYQLSIAVNHGNSGGPVFDMTGNVIGVVTLGDPDKDGLAFCITPQDLSITLAHVDALTDEEIENNRSLHRLGVLVRAISKLTRIHGHLMALYLESVEKALNEGKSAGFGLQAAHRELAPVVRRLNDENAAVDSELTKEASSISSDKHLPERIREQFSALWTNYKEIRSNVENPRGTVDAFRTKKLQLTDTHERLMHSLNLHLGIKE